MQFTSKPKDNRIKLIENNRDFLFDATSYFCNRPLQWGIDEELNVALTTFNKACEDAQDIKGNFISYCTALITDALLEYTLKLPTIAKLAYAEENKPLKNHLDSLSDFEIFFDDKERAMEIALLSQKLKEHSIKFSEIAKNTMSTEENVLVLNWVTMIYRDEVLMSTFNNTKKLIFSEVSAITNINKKQFRKYKSPMVSLLILLSDQKLLYLKSYLNIIVGDSHA